MLMALGKIALGARGSYFSYFLINDINNSNRNIFFDKNTQVSSYFN